MDGLPQLLDASLADPAFKADVDAYARHRPADRVTVIGHAPRVKVLRVLAQLLHAEPALPVERVRVQGCSGCCDFRGTVEIVAGGSGLAYEFVWDCRWRAEVEGLVDRYGFVDQARAAREFGWRCFAVWTRCDAGATPEAPGVGSAGRGGPV